MKSKIIASFLFFSTLLFSQLVFSETNAKQAVQMKQDGEVIAWIEAIDNFEVNAAQVASNKTVDTAVKDYATMLSTDHSNNLKQITSLSNDLKEPPVETKALMQFKKSGEEELKKLSSENDQNFQKMFINAMVSGHTDALHKVDTVLMKKAKNDQLKSLLKETRAMIAKHLADAKKIKSEMRK